MNIREDLLRRVTEYTEGRITEVHPDDVLTSGLGLNSLELFNLISDIQDDYKIEIPDEDLIKFKTVKDVVLYLENIVPADFDPNAAVEEKPQEKKHKFSLFKKKK